MKIHEYQAKAILARYGVPVPEGEVVFTPDEASAAARKLGGTVVVKAQIHAGSRQGRRRQGSEVIRRGTGGRAEDARHEPRHLSDRASRAESAACARGAGAQDQA